jgi:hypothetical protein
MSECIHNSNIYAKLCRVFLAKGGRDIYKMLATLSHYRSISHIFSYHIQMHRICKPQHPHTPKGQEIMMLSHLDMIDHDNHRILFHSTHPATENMWMSGDLLENPDDYAWLLQPLLREASSITTIAPLKSSFASEVPSLNICNTVSNTSLVSMFSVSSSPSEIKPELQQNHRRTAHSDWRKLTSKKPDKVRAPSLNFCL